MQTSNLEALEKRVYRSSVDHGFFDLLLAGAVAIFTLMFTASPWFVLALFPLVMGKGWLLGVFNRRVVEPRVGHVRLGTARLEQISTARKTAAIAFFGLSLIVARLGDLASPVWPSAALVWLAETPQFQMAVIAGAATAVAGWLFGLPRFMAHGVVIVLAPLMAALAGLPAGTGWAIATVVVATIGARLLYRFVADNPEFPE
ncbi:MAG: hypothetical protein GVY11_07190 [Gammaproteobacteria bacterium]|jgi:hypothetical protein|nr:hypothetical protein [Gammaproteobacteria bacterium]